MTRAHISGLSHLTKHINIRFFAVYTANVDGDTYTLIKGPGTETVEYGESMKSKSDIDMGEYEFKQTDKMVTLSTCTGDSATRFVVQESGLTRNDNAKRDFMDFQKCYKIFLFVILNTEPADEC